MSTGTTFPLVDRILEGTLAEKLREWRSAEVSYETIARLLFAEHGVEVNSATVRRWCIGLNEVSA